MADSVKIGENSICAGCSDTPSPDQCVQCFTCKQSFHAVCEAVDKDNMVGIKTMVKMFLGGSTKVNFKFFCDICLTKLEVSMVETESQKINGLEKKVANMESKLDVITNLLKNSNNVQPKTSPSKDCNSTTIWQDKEMYSTVAAPSPKSVLVIKNSEDAVQNDSNQDEVDKVIMSNKIPVTQSYKNKSGDIVVECETSDIRDELKNIVASTDQNIVMNSPSEKRQSITIVGLPKEYKKEEVIQMLVLQNGFIKGFANKNDINKHIEIYAVRPLRNDPSKFQVFATVSSVLREGIQYFSNKVTLGLSTCKVYDRFHVKRCNNCQHFGHYMRDCPAPTTQVCGKCSENHSTNECTSDLSKCVNCVREKIVETNHHTSSFKCPCLVKQQETLKNRQYNLNLRMRNNPSPR